MILVVGWGLGGGTVMISNGFSGNTAVAPTKHNSGKHIISHLTLV
ncbi:hypothetical protein [Candidatus Nitrosocosmicus sp. R]